MEREGCQTSEESQAQHTQKEEGSIQLKEQNAFHKGEGDN